MPIRRTLTQPWASVATLLAAAMMASGNPDLASPAAGPPGFVGGLGGSRDGSKVIIDGQPPAGPTVSSYVFDRNAQSAIPYTFSSGGSPLGVFVQTAAVTDDAGFVAFTTSTSGLVPGDNANFMTKVYLRDTQAGTTALISVATDGTLANAEAANVLGISEDGDRVLFLSNASNLVPGFNASQQGALFVRDLSSGTTEPVTLAPDGTTELGLINFDLAAITPDGSEAVFVAFDGMQTNIYRRNLNTGMTSFVALAPATPVSISDGGGSVLGIDLFGPRGIVSVTNTLTGEIREVDASAIVSGRFVESADTDDAGETIVLDVDSGMFTNDLILSDQSGMWEFPSFNGGVGELSRVSADGSTVLPNGMIAFPEHNIAPSSGAIYRTAIDVATGTPEIVEQTEVQQGDSRRASVSRSGLKVGFVTRAFIPNTNETNDAFGFDDDVMVRHRDTGLNVRIPRPNTADTFGDVDTVLVTDGGCVAFIADTFGNTPPFDFGFQLWTYDLSLNLTVLNRPFGNLIPTGGSVVQLSDMSADGTDVLFETDAALIAGDTNNASDIYVFDTQTLATRLISMLTLDTTGAGASDGASMTADGNTVVFRSSAPQFTEGMVSSTLVRYMRDAGTFETFINDPIPLGIPDVANDGNTVAVGIVSGTDINDPIVDIGVYDLTQCVLIANLPTLGGPPNAPIFGPAISGD